MQNEGIPFFGYNGSIENGSAMGSMRDALAEAAEDGI